MRPSRPLDALYGTQRAVQVPSASPERRPRFQQLFSELRERHAQKQQQAAAPSRAASQGDAVSGRPPHVSQGMPHAQTNAQNPPGKRRDTPWVGAKPGSASRGRASPPKLAAYQSAKPRQVPLDKSVTAQRQRLKAAFEASLPPLSDSKNIALRRKLMEAWDAAQWREREEYIARMQEQHVQALQHAITRQEHEAEQRLLQRLSIRFAKMDAVAQQSLEVLHRQHEAYAAQLLKKHQQLRQRARGAKPSRLDSLQLAHVQGQRIVRALRKPWAAQSLLALPEMAGGAAAALPDRATLSASAHRSGSDAPALGRGSASDARKQAEYVRHLDDSHRALEAKKMAAQQVGELEGFAHTAASSLPQHAAPFSGLLAEEDDLLHAVLSKTPLSLGSGAPQPSYDVTEPAAARMPAAAHAEELGSGVLQSENAAAAEHDIDSMLEDMLENATNHVGAAAGPLAFQGGAAHQEVRSQLGSLQDQEPALGMQAAAQDAELQHLAWQDSIKEAQPNSLTAVGGDFRSTPRDSGDKPWADQGETSVDSIVEALLHDIIAGSQPAKLIALLD